MEPDYFHGPTSRLPLGAARFLRITVYSMNTISIADDRILERSQEPRQSYAVNLAPESHAGVYARTLDDTSVVAFLRIATLMRAASSTDGNLGVRTTPAIAVKHNSNGVHAKLMTSVVKRRTTRERASQDRHERLRSRRRYQRSHPRPTNILPMPPSLSRR
jgi:hypothetical protein